TRVSLIIALVAAVIDLFIGVAYGGISAYYGGRVDNIMQRILEILIGIPNLVVIVLMILILQPGITSIVIALTITGWTGMARIVRGEVLKLKGQEFVLAARTLGTSNGKILRKHLIPNISGIIIINTMFTIPSAIFFEDFLRFIGLSLVPPETSFRTLINAVFEINRLYSDILCIIVICSDLNESSLGTLVNAGFENIWLYPYLLVYPAVLISVIMIAFNLIGDGLRDAFDPKMHK